MCSDAATAAQKYQKLNDSLAAFNPAYKPLGFTINSLSSCSESVLADALLATKTAMSTILSSIGKTNFSITYKNFHYVWISEKTSVFNHILKLFILEVKALSGKLFKFLHF